MTAPATDRVRVGEHRRSTRANALALSGGRAAAAAGQWLALVVLAKATDVQSVGVYALAQAICIPVAEIARLGLREVRATDVLDRFASSTYLSLRLASSGVAFAVMVLAGLLVADGRTAVLVVVLYAMTRMVELWSDILYAILQREERLDLVARSLGLLALASLGGLAAGLLITGSVLGAVAGQVVAYALVFAGYDLRVASVHVPDDTGEGRLRPDWSATALAALARRTLPLAVATVLAMVSLHTTRLVVVGELGVEALGLFVPVTVLALAPGRILQAVGAAATTRLAVLHASGHRREFVGLVGVLLGVTAALSSVGVAGTVLFGERLLGLVYTDAYRDQATVLTLVVVAAGLRFSAEMVQQAVVAAQRYWWLTGNFAANAVVAVVVSLVLIPPHGLVGAAGSLVVVAGVHLITVTVAAMANLPGQRPVTAEVGAA